MHTVDPAGVALSFLNAALAYADYLDWRDAERFREFQLLDVPGKDSAAANALLINDVVIIPASFPRPAHCLSRGGFACKRSTCLGCRKPKLA
jgi:hypothetical protein